MTRDQKRDYEALRSFIDDYSLSAVAAKDFYKGELRKLHKHYLSLLTWSAEISGRKKELSAAYSVTDESVELVLESISDAGFSVFNWIHGCYKPSKVILRCGIENFVRSISSIENPSQLTNTIVYDMLDEAKKTSAFSSSQERLHLFGSLRHKYKTLCKTVHTAKASELGLISSLADFPNFDESDAKETSHRLVETMQQMNTLLSLEFNDFYHGMHFSNRRNILKTAASSVKPAISGEKETPP